MKKENIWLAVGIVIVALVIIYLVASPKNANSPDVIPQEEPSEVNEVTEPTIEIEESTTENPTPEAEN